MKHVKDFMIFALVLNSPGLLALVPLLRPIVFVPFLFWVNVPAMWCGLAQWLGPAHMGVGSFGAMPQTVVAWLAIGAFWLVPAAGLTVLQAYWPWPARKREWRFSLRALLVVMTVVALVLGALVWWVTGGR